MLDINPNFAHVKNEKIYECGGKDIIGKQVQNGIWLKRKISCNSLPYGTWSEPIKVYQPRLKVCTIIKMSIYYL